MTKKLNPDLRVSIIFSIALMIAGAPLHGLAQRTTSSNTSRISPSPHKLDQMGLKDRAELERRLRLEGMIGVVTEGKEEFEKKKQLLEKLETEVEVKQKTIENAEMKLGAGDGKLKGQQESRARWQKNAVNLRADENRLQRLIRDRREAGLDTFRADQKLNEVERDIREADRNVQQWDTYFEKVSKLQDSVDKLKAEVKSASGVLDVTRMQLRNKGYTEVEKVLGSSAEDKWVFFSHKDGEIIEELTFKVTETRTTYSYDENNQLRKETSEPRTYWRKTGRTRIRPKGKPGIGVTESSDTSG